MNSYDKLLQPVETMPLKSPVDFVKLRVSTVQEYLLIYLLCDGGTQLADVFGSFCNHIKGTHKLNPLFFYGAPSLSYNAMLYRFRGDGNVHPVLLSEPNMAGFFTQMIRGGTAFICTRLAEASEDEKIIYLDANNLYGWAMSQKLSALQWVQVDEPD